MSKYRKRMILCSIVLAFLGGFLCLERNHPQMRVDSILPFGQEDELDAEDPRIRVLIKSEGFSHEVHPKVAFQCEAGMRVTSKDKQTEISGVDTVTFEPDDALFQGGTILVEAMDPNAKVTISSLERGDGLPSYYGSFELFTTAEGIVVVNEVNLERYLCGVLPSEMPASYEMEALKCQAVCARSYAYFHMKAFAYPEYNAHVDDSTSFQVYGNSNEDERTNQAIQETKGQLLWFEENVARTYFYSTSCGNTASIEAWGTNRSDENAYLQSVQVKNSEGEDYEKDLPWYRWSASVSSDILEGAVESNAGKELGALENITVIETGDGGIVQKLKVVGSQDSVEVETENKIRRLFASDEYQVVKQDGAKYSVSSLLPSAFFTIEKKGEEYLIQGGGFGHGIGMSQNGANEMAKEGMNYKSILTTFYPGTYLE